VECAFGRTPEEPLQSGIVKVQGRFRLMWMRVVVWEIWADEMSEKIIASEITGGGEDSKRQRKKGRFRHSRKDALGAL